DGPEPLYFLPRVNGTYTLEVRSPDKNASGKYEIVIKELRQANPQDSDFIQATDYFAKGLNLYRAVGTLTAREEAIKSFEAAIPLWQKLGKTAQEAASVNYIGEVYYSLDNYPKALAYFKQALPLSRGAADRVLEGNIYNNIGLTNHTIGESQ